MKRKVDSIFLEIAPIHIIYAQQASRDILTNIDMSKLCMGWAPGADWQLGNVACSFSEHENTKMM